VSTASLVIGVSASAASRSVVLVAGLAGLVAGAMSMATGEYVSVSSQRDAEQADIALERGELAANPELELAELAAIYQRRGLDEELARTVAGRLMAVDPLAAHVRDELGLSEVLMARPVQAAVVSAVSFAAGAVLPLLAVVLAPPRFGSWRWPGPRWWCWGCWAGWAAGWVGRRRGGGLGGCWSGVVWRWRRPRRSAGSLARSACRRPGLAVDRRSAGRCRRQGRVDDGDVAVGRCGPYAEPVGAQVGPGRRGAGAGRRACCYGKACALGSSSVLLGGCAWQRVGRLGAVAPRPMSDVAAPATSQRSTLDLAAAARQPVEVVLQDLGSTQAGLTSEEAARRLASVGRNVLASHKVTALGVLGRQLRNPLLLLLLAAAGVSAATGDPTDGAIIAAIVVLSVGLGFINEYRSERAVTALHANIRHQALVWRDGNQQRLGRARPGPRRRGGPARG
jgi:hypothetical protein